MNLYSPIYSSECWHCRRSPTVGIKDRRQVLNNGLIDTELCGICFFQDHEMINPELWNDEEDS